MENSKIQWTDHTFNPWMGCTKVSAGCKHCYAEALMDRRLGRVEWGPTGTRVRTGHANWRKPVKWAVDACMADRRDRVFCASLADVFELHESIEAEWRLDLWALVESTKELDWLLLTKRPENVGQLVPLQWHVNGFPRNVWIGTTVEDQDAADQRIPLLKQYPASVRFLSCEPLVGPVFLGDHLDGIDWVIVGGESGPEARVSDPSWFGSLIGECEERGVPVFVKQLGTRWAAELKLDDRKGGDMDEWPEALCVRQQPTPQNRRTT